MTIRARFTSRLLCSLAAVVPLVLSSSLLATSTGDNLTVAAEWTPTAELIAQLEHKVRLPDGASPLLSYTRYYAGSTVQGHRVVFGTYQHSGAGGVVIAKSVHDLPIVYDGGCDFIYFRYDVLKKRFLDIFCNGIA
jgi:hypothetical protein